MRNTSRISTIVISILTVIMVFGFVGCWTRSNSLTKEPKAIDQRQSWARIEAITELDFQRFGIVKVSALQMDNNNSNGERVRVSYSLHAPATAVEDTDIRGFLDGTMKYPFNQGTSYHIRVGRRFDGALHGEYELKRSLVRWTPPELPEGARVVSAQVTFWVEEYYGSSPFAKPEEDVLLHLYVYPLRTSWSAGQGGIDENSFSDAATGEASWTEGRAGVSRWPAPGALALDPQNPGRKYVADPIAAAVIEQDNSDVTLSSQRLADYLQQSINENKSFDLLVKLDDQEEDRRGTETGIFSSDFGDERDIDVKRPRLDFELEFEVPSVSNESEFVLEGGMEYVLPIMAHQGKPSLISAVVSADGDEVPPEIWFRGGRAGNTAGANWQRYHHPVEVDWDWSQVKLSAAFNRVHWGERFSVKLLETWVRPGPRSIQVPEMALIAPSGMIYRVDGQADSDYHYLLEFQPLEPGLWRYGWSFRPRQSNRLGSHQGEGLFYVDFSDDGSEAEILNQYAESLIASLQVRRKSDPSLEFQINTFVRRAAEFAQKGPVEQQISERLIGRLRQALTKREDSVPENNGILERIEQKARDAMVSLAAKVKG